MWRERGEEGHKRRPSARQGKQLQFFAKNILTKFRFCGIIFQSPINNMFKAEQIRRSRVAGRARTIGNRVTVKSGSRVRISPSPLNKKELLLCKSSFLFFIENNSIKRVPPK